jgi:uncharacterized membrane protein
LLLARSFRILSCSITVCIFHLSVAVAGTAVMVRVEFFANFRFGLGLEVLINALIVLVSTTAIRDTPVVTRGKVVVLKCGCKDCS